MGERKAMFQYDANWHRQVVSIARNRVFDVGTARTGRLQGFSIFQEMDGEVEIHRMHPLNSHRLFGWPSRFLPSNLVSPFRWRNRTRPETSSAWSDLEALPVGCSVAELYCRRGFQLQASR